MSGTAVARRLGLTQPPVSIAVGQGETIGEGKGFKLLELQSYGFMSHKSLRPHSSERSHPHKTTEFLCLNGDIRRIPLLKC